MLALAIDGEPVAGSGRAGSEPGALVTNVGPDPCRPGAALAWRLQLDRGVVGEDRLTAQNVAADGIGDRLEQGRGLADPVTKGRAIELDAVALENLRLPVQGQVITVFA